MATRFAVDTGGTFTDCTATLEGGAQRTVKVLSSSALRGRITHVDGACCAYESAEPWPAGILVGCTFRSLATGATARIVSSTAGEFVLEEAVGEPGAFEACSPEPAPVLAARMVTGIAAPQAIDGSLRLATTRGTNALLERKGAPVLLVTTRGFGDVARIGDQRRPDLFALAPQRPPPLHAAVIEVDERIAATGEVLRAPDLDAFARDVAQHAGDVPRAVAVVLLHADRYPAHERAIADRLRALGFDPVVTSSEVSPRTGFLTRLRTTVTEATLAPVVSTYLHDVGRAFTREVDVLASDGALVGAGEFRACDSLLSGPAGGVLGAAAVGDACGFERVIAFDMGGTSTDVARIDGTPAQRPIHTVGDVELARPAFAIETVAAGGGSICWHDGAHLRVGPQSAGADPGPACYGAGGPLTLTDVNLLLGRLDAGSFGVPVDRAAAMARADELLGAVDDGAPGSRERLLEGLVRIADERMADAIRRVSVAEGVDPSSAALVSFGGAGGQHACAVADRLDIRTVLFPAEASVLSAVGLAGTSVKRTVERALESSDAADATVVDALEAAAAEASAAVRKRSPGSAVTIEQRTVRVRIAAQAYTIDVEVTGRGDVIGEAHAGFAAAFAARFGYALPDVPLELVAVTARAAAPSAGQTLSGVPANITALAEPAWLDGAWRNASGTDGPAVLRAARTTLVIPVGWRLTVEGSTVIAQRVEAAASAAVVPEAVRDALIVNRLTAAATEMGEALRATAMSTNVRERLDYSCAVLDAAGSLVVNAPHIPVHLGAMGTCVRAVRRELAIDAGDVVITNHPAYGGTHLPDVTLIARVDDEAGTCLGYVASRAHHAELGGCAPGSMPPDATQLVEEGVVIAPQYLVRGGEPRFDEIATLLRNGPFPSRRVEENIADLRAQLAALRRGEAMLRSAASDFGADVVRERLAALTDRSEALARAALAGAIDGERSGVRRLDDGTVLSVRFSTGGERAIIDFNGTGPVHPGSLNATPAIVASAVMYILRLLVGESLPLNDGLLRAVDIELPESILAPRFVDDPAECPAVVGGNVETSQQVVSLLLGTLGLAADSQSTMNNVIFGDGGIAHYETVGGGAGAAPGHVGASAIHTHMTNTAITDVEVLETRFPVRLERFTVRDGSGGRGRFAGGDGIVRAYRFLRPLDICILAQQRDEAPSGAAGGEAGARGQQWIERDGQRIEVGGLARCAVEAGDVLVLETPGGGGFGPVT